MGDDGRPRVLPDIREIRYYVKFDECIASGLDGIIDEGTTSERNSQPREVGACAGQLGLFTYGREKIVPLEPENWRSDPPWERVLPRVTRGRAHNTQKKIIMPPIRWKNMECEDGINIIKNEVMAWWNSKYQQRLRDVNNK